MRCRRKEAYEMWFNYYEAERMREERVKDALRKAERAQLIQVARGHGESRGWLQRARLAASNLWAWITEDSAAEPRRRSPAPRKSPT
jgi:hypothetical protein